MYCWTYLLPGTPSAYFSYGELWGVIWSLVWERASEASVARRWQILWCLNIHANCTPGHCPRMWETDSNLDEQSPHVAVVLGLTLHRDSAPQWNFARRSLYALSASCCLPSNPLYLAIPLPWTGNSVHFWKTPALLSLGQWAGRCQRAGLASISVHIQPRLWNTIFAHPALSHNLLKWSFAQSLVPNAFTTSFEDVDNRNHLLACCAGACWASLQIPRPPSQFHAHDSPLQVDCRRHNNLFTASLTIPSRRLSLANLSSARLAR